MTAGGCSTAVNLPEQSAEHCEKQRGARLTGCHEECQRDEDEPGARELSHARSVPWTLPQSVQ